MQPKLISPRGRRAHRHAGAPNVERRVSGSAQAPRDAATAAVLARETHTSWFEQARPSTHEASRGSRWTPFSDLFSEPRVVVQAAGEQPPAVAGALAGGLGALLGFVAFVLAAPSASVALAISSRLGRALSLGMVGAPLDAGLGALSGFGACVGVGLAFAVLARRLRRPLPLLALAGVGGFAAALTVRCVLLARYAPELAAVLPIGPTLFAAWVFACTLVLELPIRQLGALARER